MEEARILLPFRPVAGVHAPGLKVAAVGDAAYFPICLLAWEPDFQVKGLARAKAHIAGAQQHSSVGQLKRLQNPLRGGQHFLRSEEHTSELQSLMRISYAVFCLKKNKTHIHH